jgi:hypothetical protein
MICPRTESDVDSLSRAPRRAQASGGTPRALDLLALLVPVLVPVLVALLVLVPSPRLAARLIIIEVHYHPAGPPEAAEGHEFVEVLNDEPLPFDAGDYLLTGGIAFAFPPGTLIPARSVVVVARDPTALAARHGIEPPLGPFAGRLDNGGDEVVLIDTGGSAVSRVAYRDGAAGDGWPAAPDGAGPSLVLRHPLLDPGENESWGWSDVSGGTPGAVSFAAVEPEVVLNEVGRDGAGTGWVELFHGGAEPVDLAGWTLAGGAAGTARYTFPPGSLLEPRGRLTLAESALGFALPAGGLTLILEAPGGAGATVMDARSLGASLSGASDGCFPEGGSGSGSGGAWLRLEPTRGTANRALSSAPLAISEIHYHPLSADEAEEFIEVANAGDARIPLDGFAFTAGVRFAFPPGAAIGPRERLVVAKDPGAVRAVYGLGEVHGPWEGALANGGEMLRLSDPAGNPVDEVRYRDEGEWSPWADGFGPSLELVDLRQMNAAGAAWEESEHAAGWVEHEYTGFPRVGDSELHVYLLGAGEALIDDLEVTPEGGGGNLIPNGSFDDLDGWLIEGTHVESRLEPGGGPDGSSALRIVASGDGDARVNRLERQTAPDFVLGAAYVVRFKARWLRGSSLLMTRSWNHGLSRVTRLDVPAAGGTPGSENSRARADSGPIVSGLHLEPPLPAPGAAVTVEARVSDPDGVQRVDLHFRLDGDPVFETIAMRDDGVAPDRLGGDGIYAALVAERGGPGETAELWIDASDGSALERAFPAGAPEHTVLYQYDDDIAAHAVPAYRLAVTERSYEILRNRSPLADDLLPASLIYRDERLFPLAGLRYRGSPYLRRDSITGERKGFHVRLRDDDAMASSTRLTLDEQAIDPTYQADRLVRRFLQKAGGIPYGERHHVHLIVRGASFGTYEHVLNVDARYLERAWGAGDGGELYKIDAHYEIDDRGEFPTPRFTSWRYTEDKESLRYTYPKRSHEEEDDFSGLMALLDLMDLSRTPDAAFDARAGELWDLDALVRSIAVFRAVEDWDTIGGWTGKNVYLYHHPDGRWRVIPWDHDVSFGSAALRGDHNPRAYLYTPYFPEVRRLLARPVLDRKFNAELLRLLEEDYRRDVVDPILDETHALLAGATGASGPAGIKTFLSERRAHLLSQISDPPFVIETNGGLPFRTAEPTVLLSGRAPLSVEAIAVNGEDPGLHWRNRETWELEAPLAPGRNSLVLLAFDRRAHLVGAAEIEVTRGDPSRDFARGDANGDARYDLSDPVATLDFLFLGAEIACEDAADANDSGALNITDPLYSLNFLFLGGPELPAPFPAIGPDPSADALECSGAP